jgi:aspartate/methionine/tyrosine aminotransferase
LVGIQRRTGNKARQGTKNGLEVKALAMINPGNPSGNVMTHCDIQVIAEFCAEHGIVMLADEVYQTNVYAATAEFVSAKKVALDRRLKNLQLVSFHSTSKGLIGECGRRGGYMVSINFLHFLFSFCLHNAFSCFGSPSHQSVYFPFTK